MPHFKDKPFRSVIPTELRNPNQLALPLTETDNRLAPIATAQLKPTIILPPANAYNDDPEFIKAAIIKVRDENHGKRRKSYKLYKQAIW